MQGPPTAHIYIYSDACPTDWLDAGPEDTWHTFANFLFQSDPHLQSSVEQAKPPHEVLASDSMYGELVTQFQAQLPSRQMRKWKTGPAYREKFCRAFKLLHEKLLVNAISFQEKTLRASKQALLSTYNDRIGGFEGNVIAFGEFKDDRGRTQMKRSFVNFNGYQELQAPESQMLVMLLMSWFIADQYDFYRKEWTENGNSGYDRLALTVVSDRLSGDDDFRAKSEQNLRNLIDPNGVDSPIVLTRSPQSDLQFGDLLVDNLAGWLNAAISDPCCEVGRLASTLTPTGIWKGWCELLPSTSTLNRTHAALRLNCP